jgi:hypothetical protein
MCARLCLIYRNSRVKPPAIIRASARAREIKNKGLLEILERGAIKTMGTKAKIAMGNAHKAGYAIVQYIHFKPTTKQAAAPIIKIIRLASIIRETPNSR